MAGAWATHENDVAFYFDGVWNFLEPEIAQGRGIYDANAKRYVHIPRSRQRIRYLSGKHPRPPPSVEDKEIKDLITKVGLKSDRGQTQDGPFAPEEKRSVVDEKKGTSAGPPVDNSAKWWKTPESMAAKARSLGIEPKPGESKDSLYKRVKTLLEAKAKS